MDLSPHKSKIIIIEDASTEIDDMKILGDTALSIITMTAKGKILGTPFEGIFRYFRVSKLFDNTVKMISASFKQLP